MRINFDIPLMDHQFRRIDTWISIILGQDQYHMENLRDFHYYL